MKGMSIHRPTLVLAKQAHYRTKSKGTMVPTLFFALLPPAPVLAVHAASKKFKVAVVVDTLKEKGKWQETFQVTLSLCDVVSSSFVSV